MAHSTERFIVLCFVAVGQIWVRIQPGIPSLILNQSRKFSSKTAGNLPEQQQEIFTRAAAGNLPEQQQEIFTRAAAGNLAVREQGIYQCSSRKFTRAAAGNNYQSRQEI